MTPIGKNTGNGMASSAINASTIKAQALRGGSPPPRAKSDPTSHALTVNKVTKPDTGQIEFGDQRYEAALIREVNALRVNPKKYAKVLSTHVESNPKKFNLADSAFKASLDEALTTLKKKGKDIEAGRMSLLPLNYNRERSTIAGKGMNLLTDRGLDLMTKQGGVLGVDTKNSNFLDAFVDHGSIEHLRKGGRGADGKVTPGSNDALKALKEKADEQVFFHATDLENLHVSTHDSVTVRDVITGWLIDHGTDSRGHRNALLNIGITEIGVGTSTANIVDAAGRDVTVKLTGMNFYGVYDFSTDSLMENPPTK